jgi:glycerol-3-phosphate dehydrogenase
VHLDDLMLRRTRLGLLLDNGGDAILEDIRRLFVEVLDWTENEWQSELARYREIIRQHYTLPVGALP